MRTEGGVTCPGCWPWGLATLWPRSHSTTACRPTARDTAAEPQSGNMSQFSRSWSSMSSWSTSIKFLIEENETNFSVVYLIPILLFVLIRWKEGMKSEQWFMRKLCRCYQWSTLHHNTTLLLYVSSAQIISFLLPEQSNKLLRAVIINNEMNCSTHIQRLSN